MNKLPMVLVMLCAVIAGCAISPDSTSDAKSVIPTTTDVSLMTPANERVSLTFVDANGLFFICPLAHVYLTLDAKDFAVLQHDQRVTIYVKPGNHEVSAERPRDENCPASNISIQIIATLGHPQVWTISLSHGGLMLTPQT